MKNIKQIINLYNQSSKKNLEHEKVLWASDNTMLNRYKLFFNLIKKKKINNWLDIGSGTGLIFQIHDKKKMECNLRTGLELNKNLYLFSKKKKYLNKTKLINKDIMKFYPKNKFDLISLVGVLQNCGHNYTKVINKVINLLEPNGILFLTTKNYLWKKNKKIDPKKNDHEWINPNVLKKILKKNNFKNIKILGFETNSGKIVKIKNSSTFFVYAQNI